jgi:MFS family permease
MRVLLDTEPLRHRPFRRLWATTAVTGIGSQLTAVAVPLQVYDLTGSSAYVGLADLAAFVPLVVSALWGGALADVVDRRRILLTTQTGMAVVSALFWAQAAVGARSVPVLLVLVAAQQALFGAGAAVRGAVVPRVVPPELLPGANALQSMVTWFGGIAGPLLAGTLVAVFGLPTLYLLDALAICAALPAVRGLPDLPVTGGGGAGGRLGPGAVAEGLRYVVTRPALLVVYLADFTAMFFGMPAALFPQVAHQVFGDPAGGGIVIGVLSAAMSAGALLGACLSGTYSRIGRHGVMVTAAACCWGAAIAGFGLATSLPVAAVLLAVSGVALLVLGVFRKTILHTAAEDRVRGRLQGIDTVVAAGGPLLAGLAHGLVAATLGPTWAITGGGVLALLAMLAAVLAFPSFWAIGRTAP